MTASNDASLRVWDAMVPTQAEKIETPTKFTWPVGKGEVPPAVQAKLVELIEILRRQNKGHQQKRCTEDPQTCHVYVNKSKGPGACDICTRWTGIDGGDLRVPAVVGKNQTYDGKSVRYICSLCWPKYVASRGYDICHGERCGVWMGMVAAAYPNTNTQLTTLMKGSAVVPPPATCAAGSAATCAASISRLCCVAPPPCGC